MRDRALRKIAQQRVDGSPEPSRTVLENRPTLRQAGARFAQLSRSRGALFAGRRLPGELVGVAELRAGDEHDFLSVTAEVG
jgi:hypothetical protein